MTAVTPLLTHWSYCSLALSHRYEHIMYIHITDISQKCCCARTYVMKVNIRHMDISPLQLDCRSYCLNKTEKNLDLQNYHFVKFSCFECHSAISYYRLINESICMELVLSQFKLKSATKNIYIYQWLNTLRPRQDAAIFQTTFSNAFSWMKMFKFRWSFHWSLFFPNVPINNIPALVQIMAWHRPGDKSLS